MLGLIFIYFLGKYFYELAINNNRSAWGYAILGVLSYYAGTVVFAIIIALIIEFNSPGSIDEMNDTLMGLAGVPFGLLTAWGLYQFLKRRFDKQATMTNSLSGYNLLDDDLINESSNNS